MEYTDEVFGADDFKLDVSVEEFHLPENLEPSDWATHSILYEGEY